VTNRCISDSKVEDIWLWIEASLKIGSWCVVFSDQHLLTKVLNINRPRCSLSSYT